MTRTKPKRVTGPWNLTDLAQVPSNGLTAFSCFHCGGGSTMGYKLAGFNVLGGVEIDPEMMKLYRVNHHPKHSYLMGVQQFNQIPLDELPDELKHLDLLDGSPPCSSFSLAGSREKKWGDAHHFREGQARQVLDDLFFHFVETGQRLQPKVIVAENVKGLILGRAKGYVKEIFAAFKEASYDVQLFLFNAARMGVPQARERTFFIARRRDLGWQPLKMAFNEPVVTVRDAIPSNTGSDSIIAGRTLKLYKKTLPGTSFASAAGGGCFSLKRLHWDRPANTIPGSSVIFHPEIPRRINHCEHIRLQSFPDNYNSLLVNVGYVCGMSVPPFMTQRVALEIGRQWFGVDYD